MIGEGWALVVSAKLPVSAPADVGANSTTKLVLSPPAMVNGNDIPFRLNPGPLTATLMTSALPRPVFVTLTIWSPLVPSATLPN